MYLEVRSARVVAESGPVLETPNLGLLGPKPMSKSNSRGHKSGPTTDVQITYHIEPAAQGGEQFARCESCGRELLCSLGGAESILHREDCPNA